MSDILLTSPPQAQDESPKRRQVLHAATELFLAQGYGAVSMDMVARAAAVSKATLYAYFASKDALFGTIVREFGLVTWLDDTLFPERVTDLRAALERLGGRMMRFLLQERTLGIYRIAVAESARFPELGRAFYDAGPGVCLARAAQWLARQQAAGLMRAGDAEVATHQLMSLLRAGVLLRATLALPPPPSDAEIDATVAAAVETWLRAYAPAAPEPATREPAGAGFTAPASLAYV